MTDSWKVALAQGVGAALIIVALAVLFNGWPC